MKTASAENLRSRRVVAGSTWHRNSPGAPLARDPRRGVHPPLRQFGRWLATAALLVCLVLANRGLALDPTRDLLQYNCQTWTRQTGLPANGLYAITQTEDGYLWLGTQSGMVRFDGVQFTSFNLPEGPQFRSEVISSLASSRDGGLWFGIVNGSLGFYDEKNGISAPEDARWMNPGMNVIALHTSKDGSLWVGTDRGVARYVKGNPGAAFFDDQLAAVRTISEDSLGRIWLVSVAKGLFYRQEGTIIPFPDDSLRTEQIATVASDRQGSLWVGTSRGLRCYDSSFRRKEIPPFPTEVKALLVDQHGFVWIGTVGQGVARYKNGEFSFLRRGDGLAHDIVTSLFEDREGSIWIGTREGLSQLTDLKFPIYSAAQGLLPGLYHGLSASARGGLWIGTSHGVSYFDGTTATNYTTTEGLSHPYVKRTLEARNGDLYLMNGGMAIDVLVQGKVVATFPNQRWPLAMAEDNGGVVVAVADQLFRVSRGGMVPFVFSAGQTFPSVTWIRNLVGSRDGALWVATVNGILRVKEGAVRQWTTDDGLSDNDVNTLCEDADGVIWAGLTTGVARIKDGQIRNINRADGLMDNVIFAIVPDDHGDLWLNSSRGIFRVSRKALNEFADGKSGHVESVAFNGINVVKTIDSAEVENVGCKTSDGRVWFPSPLGAVAIDPTNIPANPIPPAVRIESIHANAKNLPGDQRQVVPPGPGALEIHFTAPSFLAPHDLRFRYRLEGYDQDWIETGNRREAFYTNLGPGRYTFHVTAANADGVWNQAGDSLEIELRPHFYQTTWFNLSCVALSLGALTGLYRWRTRLLRLRERVLEENRIHLETEVKNRTAELLRENSERKRVEAALRVAHDGLERRVEERTRDLAREQARFKFIFDAVPVGISWLVPNEDHTHLVNAAHAHITGVSADESRIPGAFARVSHPDDYERQKVLTRQFLNGEIDHYSIEKRYLHRDGRIVWALLTSRMFADPVTGKKQSVTTLVDLTKRKQTEIKLAEASGLLETMLENSPDLIYFKDRDSRFVRFSQACLGRFGMTEPGDLLGKCDADIYTPEHAEPALADEQEIIRAGQPIVNKLEKETYPGGRVTWALTTKMAWRDGSGAIIGTFGISKDVTPLKETEAKLAYERDQLRALLESVPDAIYFKDDQSRFVLVSHSKVQKALTHTPDLRDRRRVRNVPADVVDSELLTGLTDFDLYQQDDARRAWDQEQQIIRSGEPIIGQVEKMRCTDGSLRWSVTSKLPWRSPAGEIIGTFGISKDVTELKLAEAKLEEMHEELLESSRQAGMAEVATEVLHNVGNVLNSVNVSATIVADRVRHSASANVAKLAELFARHQADLADFLVHDPQGQLIPDFLGKLAETLRAEQDTLVTELGDLRKNIEHINSIVAMQQAHTLVSGFTETLTLPDLIEDALQINPTSLARDQIELRRDYQARPSITTDKHKVIQILVKLLNNAKRACDESGRTDKQITIRTTSDSRIIQIAVIDNGVGIPAENLTRIFNHGFSTRQDGHGFGLHSGALAAQQLRGTLSVQSAGLGQGATFVLELPYTP